MTLFLNPAEQSYARLGRDKAPAYVSWSEENRSQLLRVPAAAGQYKRLELRSPDALANPYLAFALMIHASLDGIEREMALPAPADVNLLRADDKVLAQFEKLPATRKAAAKKAKRSDFIRAHVPEEVLAAYLK